ncbi:hypothetical protein [Lentzea flava]|uniref:Uncharacterized protein n=1 Tax=Lentzea flava TaxID=103732 RepID=A0ABQ2UE64_9PSEU|nr:hypothetical protein [Lentzea flava]MCP2197775.1 hypothetical protein [Lentzea flava]GGU22088.1 hypothetical protein GCM10010178_13000 [Lentzea flava]
MSWLRRLLLLAGLVTGAWLLGSAGEAHADVKIEIDQLKIEVGLPVADVGLKIETGLVPQQPQAPAPPTPNPRTEAPAPQPVVPQTPPQPVVEAPVQAEAPQQQATPPPSATRPANPVPAQPQPQPQAEQPITGTLPQSGAGQANGNQIPAGTLTYALRPPATTTSLVSTEQQDVPRIVRAEEPTFSPD